MPGIFRDSYDPSGVTKAIFGTSASGIVTCQYPLLKSIFERTCLHSTSEKGQQLLALVRDRTRLAC